MSTTGATGAAVLDCGISDACVVLGQGVATGCMVLASMLAGLAVASAQAVVTAMGRVSGEVSNGTGSVAVPTDVTTLGFTVGKVRKVTGIGVVVCNGLWNKEAIAHHGNPAKQDC